MEQIKQRLTTNWTLTRGIYLALGLYVIISSLMGDQQWLSLLLGVYVASMGLFSFGCASGACYGGSCEVEAEKPNFKVPK